MSFCLILQAALGGGASAGASAGGYAGTGGYSGISNRGSFFDSIFNVYSLFFNFIDLN
jgi:hypothetical protein